MAAKLPKDVRKTIRFILDGEIVELRNCDPTRTVLQYLREDLQRVGTKEGCAEGDCGACTVVIGELVSVPDGLQLRAINSCIQFLPTLDGKVLFTIESLAAESGELHPVQQAMVECHGSQCGFCTPGFVMSLFALYKSAAHPDRREIDNALAGNLCRCTGYRPIVDAARKMYDYHSTENKDKSSWLSVPGSTVLDELSVTEAQQVDKLRSIAATGTLHLEFDGKQYYAPDSIEELAALLRQNPDACILSGGTDIGLWVTKQHRHLASVIYTGNIQSFKQISVSASHLTIGAGAPISDVMPMLSQYFPELDELFLRFASPPIRNAGTLGGNIANASPIGDSMPVLIVLGAELLLRSGDNNRVIALDDFYLDYQKTALARGEFVQEVRIPLPATDATVRTYKLSKRFDQDISAVCAAFSVAFNENIVTNVRIAYGGMAAIPKRAVKCELALLGKQWDDAGILEAVSALDRDFAPLTDMRASDGYRRNAAANLLRRFYIDSKQGETLTNVYHYGR